MPRFRTIAALALIALSLTGCFRKRKYENPITKDTQQPDKVLFDKAVGDIERGRYEVARLTLNTLMNTYDTSEYLAKAKLAIADSWMREGGSHALGQAEAEYKDFILFYPTLEESAEAQQKVCQIHVKQMEKPDRDPKHAFRAHDECSALLANYPNSKFAPGTQQLLRNIDQVIAESEMRVGTYYHNKGSNPAAANRLQGLADQFPLYSNADEALYMLADSYSKMGNRFRDKTIDSYSRLVKDYPLSGFVDDSKKRLAALEAPIPEADPVALARMKYEIENRTKNSLLHKVWTPFNKSPDMTQSAKSGTPNTTGLKPSIPVSVPVPAPVAGNNDVTLGVVGANDKTLENNPDARLKQPDAAKPEGEKKEGEPAAAAPADKPADPLPSNRQALNAKPKKYKKPKVPKGVQ